MQIALGIERFPFQYRQKGIHISEVELFLVFKSAQFQTAYTLGSKPLVLHLGPSGVSNPPGAILTSSSSASSSPFWGSLAYGSITQPQPALSSGSQLVLILDANSSDIQPTGVSTGGSNPHLNPDAINDVLMLCHYSVSSK
jgi:hypothetical protein